jgi:hypothetical protein
VRRWAIILTPVALSVCSLPVIAQSCDVTHYRWPAKTSMALLGAPPRSVTIRGMLAWRAPPIGRGAAFRCAPRVVAEQQVLSVVGWVRRVDRTKDDGDWHIELTHRPNDPVSRCIVVEIPLPEIDTVFRRARATLDSALRETKVKRHGDLSKPLQLRITGAAFFDGEHLANSGKIRPHGRCSSTVGALWEIHPVYRIDAP